MTDKWRNRIVKYGEVDVEQVLANENNWRVHPKVQQDALLGALADIGIIQTLLVNCRTSEEWPENERNVETLVDGHLRVQLAMRKGQKTLPAIWADLTPNEERLALASLDPIAAMAVADETKLKELLAQAEAQSAGLKELLESLGKDVPMPAEDPGAQLDRASELQEKWQVRLGDLWGLGAYTVCPKCGKVHKLDKTP